MVHYFDEKGNFFCLNNNVFTLIYVKNVAFFKIMFKNAK